MISYFRLNEENTNNFLNKKIQPQNLTILSKAVKKIKINIRDLLIIRDNQVMYCYCMHT